MTQKEIVEHLGIPLTTLNDWKKQYNTRNKLYELLINLDINIAHTILNKKTNHRIFHILNRNIVDDCKFEYEDIKNAFSKNNYHDASDKEKIIYAKFFKEIGVDEIDDFAITFGISKRNIKNIYKTSPFRQINGIAKIFDKRFRLHSARENSLTVQVTPIVLQKILNKKDFVYV